MLLHTQSYAHLSKKKKESWRSVLGLMPVKLQRCSTAVRKQFDPGSVYQTKAVKVSYKVDLEPKHRAVALARSTICSDNVNFFFHSQIMHEEILKPCFFSLVLITYGVKKKVSFAHCGLRSMVRMLLDCCGLFLKYQWH